MAAIPKHKGTEKLLQQLKTRHSKLVFQLEREQKKKGATSGRGAFSIKREGAAQLVILGPTGVGKSSLISKLTNARPEISNRPFTTVEPTPGMMNFEDIQIQLVEAPALCKGASQGVGWGARVLSLARNSDGLILMVDLSQDPSEQLGVMLDELRGTHIEVMEGAGRVEIQGRDNGGIQVIPLKGFEGDPEEIKRILRTKEVHHAVVKVWGHVFPDDVLSFLVHPILFKKAIVVANKTDAKQSGDRFLLLKKSFPQLRIAEVSIHSGFGINELPKQLFNSLQIMRVYTKRPGQVITDKAMIARKDSTIGEVAKMIHNDLFSGFKFAKVWGSSRFSGEKVGLGYTLHDKDIIEIHA